jgi:hypothetical protein
VFQPSVLYSHGKLLYMDYTGLWIVKLTFTLI